jgi:tRNA (cmo5U34)-methyltransferase
MQSDPTGMHDWHSQSYVQDWIPTYGGDERTASLRRIAQLIPFDPQEEIRVLDVGGGWGPVSAVVLETFPRAKLVLHDFSEPMLDEAQQRLAGFSQEVRFHRGDLLSPGWKDGLDGQFQAVVSSLAIHNVRFPDRIRAIYEEIFPLVAPGGCFINLDQMGQGEIIRRVRQHAQRMATRQRMFEESGDWPSLSAVPAAGRGRGPSNSHRETRPEDLQRIADHEPASLANQLRWLREAGFDEVECFAREGNSALIGAFRAGSAT